MSDSNCGNFDGSWKSGNPDDKIYLYEYDEA